MVSSGSRFAPLAAVLLILAAASVPLGAAQSEQGGADESRVEDPQGDPRMVSNGQSQPPPAGDYQHLDITSLWMGQETDETFSVGATFQQDQAQGSGPPRIFNVYFTRGAPGGEEAVDYRLTQSRRGCDDGEASLEYYDVGQDGWRFRACTLLERGDKSVTFTLDKEHVVDTNHVPLRVEDTITQFWGETFTFIAPGTEFFPFLPAGVTSTYVRDRAPDEGYAPDFDIVEGATGQGHIQLYAPAPIRVSNGEATTLVYEAEVVNSGTAQDDVLLAGSDLPHESWTIRVPARLTVAAGETVRFPVILSMPFTHVHGETWTFGVRAESALDPDAWASVDFGVFFTDIPQPSEHHGGLLYAHSAPPPDDNPFAGAFTTAYAFKQTWMNPEPEDLNPDTTDEPVPAYFNEGLFTSLFGGGQQQNIARWDFPLSPGLLIGLDFEVETLGEFHSRITPSAPAQDAVLTAELLYCQPDNDTDHRGGPDNDDGGGFSFCNDEVLLAQGASESTPLTQNTPRDYAFALTVLPEADLIPFVEGSNLHLRILLFTDTPQNVATPEPKVTLDTESTWLQVPLVEYHDPVDKAFQDVGTLRLELLGPIEKRVNPGRTTLFPLKVTNNGPDAQQVTLEVEGPNAEWAHTAAGSSFEIKAGQSREVTLAVTPPLGTNEGERAELFAVAQSEDDPNVVAVSRLRATVVALETQDIPDEVLISQAAEGESPAAGVWLAASALAAAAWAGSRRGRRT